MQHFTCDSCHRVLGEERFVAKVEVYPAFDPDRITEDHLDQDHLVDLFEMLEAEQGGVEIDDYERKEFRYDLCYSCHRELLKDPLGSLLARQPKFSEN